MDEQITTHALPVDEAWIADWAAEGIAALEDSLAKHAAFEDYCRLRLVQSDDGDGAVPA